MMPPFRLIAIVHTVEAARSVVAMLTSLDTRAPIGLLLRDPAHVDENVRGMAAAVVPELPPSVHPITSGVACDGVVRVHLPFARARQAAVLTAGGSIVGVSVHSTGEVAAIDAPVEYLIASPVFPTRSKPGHPGIGIDGLRAVREAARVPVFALGGIDATTAPACLAAGAFGLAGISVFAGRPDVEALLAALTTHLTPHADQQ